MENMLSTERCAFHMLNVTIRFDSFREIGDEPLLGRAEQPTRSNKPLVPHVAVTSISMLLENMAPAAAASISEVSRDNKVSVNGPNLSLACL